MTTYLKDRIQSIGRYSDSHGNKLGLRFLDAQVVSPLSENYWLAKDYKQAPHVRGSMTI
jgi:hypothetical protein